MTDAEKIQELEAKVAELRHRESSWWASDPMIPCNDNSCILSVTKGGMRTNGGCRCFSHLPPNQTRSLRRAVMMKLQQVRDEAKEHHGSS